MCRLVTRSGWFARPTASCREQAVSAATRFDDPLIDDGDLVRLQTARRSAEPGCCNPVPATKPHEYLNSRPLLTYQHTACPPPARSVERRRPVLI